MTLKLHTKILAIGGLLLLGGLPLATASARPIIPEAISVAGNAKLEVLAQGFGSPDDLAITPQGGIVFGDFGNKAINILRSGDKPEALSKNWSEPEGIVVAKDGAYIVAEQGTNRIVEVNSTTGARKTLRQLVNKTSKEGVDGLGLDPATGDILIPDSPNGRLLRMSRDGSTLQTIASGFVRPTGAAVEPKGSIVVADEFGNAVYRLNSSGRKSWIASIYQPDDVIVGPNGSLYANSLKGDIDRIDPVTGKVTVLVSGLKLPHGLGITSDGSKLIMAEAGRNRILSLTLTK